MRFIVQVAPAVSAQLDALPRDLVREFELICSFLSVSPFPTAGIQYVHQSSFYGRRYFTYYDQVFPFVIEYRVFASDQQNRGLLVIIRLVGVEPMRRS